jgi:hypothetical protein
MSFERLLFLFGVGFLAANVLGVVQFLRSRARRARALLVWPPPRPPLAPLYLLIGVTLGLLILASLLTGRIAAASLFGNSMMLVYYLVVVRLKARVARGIYADGIWTDTGFMRWPTIDAMSWREKPRLALVVVSKTRSLARRLTVPGELYGQARRVLRERAATHDLTLGGTGLGLGTHDGADDL